MKVAIVGCGQIADAHIQELRKIQGCEIVALCDRNEYMVQQAAIRFGISGTYGNAEELLERERPEVLHVTSPPASHLEIGRQALSRGVHVYMEKPFAVNRNEAAELAELAQKNGCLICAGHSLAFDSSFLRLRELLESGGIGQLVHIDAFMSYDLSGQFGAVFMKDPTHWVHKLPGGVVQNNLSHPLSLTLPFIEDRHPRVVAYASDSEGRSFGDLRDSLLKEVRISILGREVTATVNFSCSARPVQVCVAYYGTERQAVVSTDARTVRVIDGAWMPGPFGRVQWSRREARRSTREWRKNVYKLLTADLHYFEGLAELIRRFQEAIRGAASMPVAMEEAVRLTEVMDEVFRQCLESRPKRCIS